MRNKYWVPLLVCGVISSLLGGAAFATGTLCEEKIAAAEAVCSPGANYNRIDCAAANAQADAACKEEFGSASKDAYKKVIDTANKTIKEHLKPADRKSDSSR